VKVTNTLTGKKEEFRPAGDEIKIYVCGVTPYDHAHIGHAMSYIIFDVIRRYLEYRGSKVKYVQNITDIDDKIINRAGERGITAAELAKEFIDSLNEDMTALNIKPASVNPRATEEIPFIIKVIQGLEERGFAYPSEGSVYYRVRKFDEYGKLSHRSVDDMRSGARIEAGEEKEDPLDFVLWKGSKPGEPSWDSPWGPGRPGWHIECSAMSLRYLGENLDIHGGGLDLVFPHHENEIAQSEAYTGKPPFARYWLHNGLLQLGSEKMSKSVGNLVTIKEVLRDYGADALRIFILNSHYRSPLTYGTEGLEAAAKGAERLRRAAARENGSGTAKLDPEPYQARFVEAMDDDFNSAQALAALFDLAREINAAADRGDNISAAQATLRELAGDVLGLTLKEDVQTGSDDDAIDALMAERQQCRRDKNFQQADEIRDKLAAMGITIEDTPKGAVWRRGR
jgi:cysteinyl-tRNA synthetase